MKRILTAITLVLCALGSLQAQIINDILAKNNIESAIPLFPHLSDFKSVDRIKLLGMGDVAEFARETKKLNSAFCAYLIENKKFRNILLPTDDWLLRPLNSYLNSEKPTDSLVVDSLVKSIFSSDHKFRNIEFRSFVLWVKRYNVKNTSDMVNFYGVSSNSNVPVNYFLARYIYKIDSSYGEKLNEKWRNEGTPDSIAFADIRTWIDMQKTQKKNKETSALMADCEKDLRHNSAVVKLDFKNPKFPVKVLNDRADYIAGRILEKLDKKAIFYTVNSQVVTGCLRNELVIENVPYNSVGKLLKNSLGDNYYVVVTDFAGSAKLPIVNYLTGTIEDEVAVGQEKAKQLIKKYSYVNLINNAALLQGYQPVNLAIGKNMRINVVPEIGKSVIDALFLLSDLSAIDFYN